MDDGHLFKLGPEIPITDTFLEELQADQSRAAVRAAADAIAAAYQGPTHDDPEGRPDHHHDVAQIPAIDYDPFDYTAIQHNHVVNHVYDEHHPPWESVHHVHLPTHAALHSLGAVDYALHHSAVYHHVVVIVDDIDEHGGTAAAALRDHYDAD